MLIKFAQRQEPLNLSVERNIKPLYWNGLQSEGARKIGHSL